MDGLIEYSIPVKGLHTGAHTFRFRIDRSFFQHFEHSPVSDGDIDLSLSFDKRPDLFVLEFDFEGTVKTECDRCLATIDLPVSGHQRLLVKFSETEELEDAEVIYIHPDTQQLNVSKYVYEFIVLALPMIRVYDCENDENRQCNMEMLKYLEQNEPSNGEDIEPEINPIWEQLKKSLNDN